jgi:hypothetical protein
MGISTAIGGCAAITMIGMFESQAYLVALTTIFEFFLRLLSIVCATCAVLIDDDHVVSRTVRYR